MPHFCYQFFCAFTLCLSIVHCKPASKQVSQLITAINTATKEKGGVYAEYTCKTVSWDDADRGTFDDGQGLSVWGASITDTRLWAKDGTLLFTVRSDNWNEKLGHVSADDVRLIVGNEQQPRSGSNEELTTITLRELLQEAGKYGGYAGLPADSDLSSIDADDKVSIRFQTTFLPVDDRERATLEFATEAYNYNTRSDDDPKNIVILATTQGIAVQQDGEGAKKLYHHGVDEQGTIHRYWLEAERTKHKVGGPQNETEEERKDALKRGKAVAMEIGIPAMGKRFNVLMTIQVPLNQTKTFDYGPGSMRGGSLGKNDKRQGPKEGTANAARVSRGSEVDIWDGLTVEDPQRHPNQHVTVTAVIYNTIAGGVPKKADVVAAIDDMEALYKACEWSGHLIDKEANFMKTELNNGTLNEIWGKINSQPYTLLPLNVQES